jgi:hypothetical protein
MFASVEGRTGVAAVLFPEYKAALRAERKPQDSQKQKRFEVFHTFVKLRINKAKCKVSR